MLNKVLAIVICLMAIIDATAQDLYMPRNIQKAYQQGSRSQDGKPGKNYFQNKGVYDVQVTIHPESGMVSGSERIVYSNHSRDTLKTIAIRFVNNMHKPTSPRSGVASPDYLTDGMKISSLKIDGLSYNDDAASWGTVHEIKLQQPILPASSATVEIAWSYPLSNESGREGRIDSTTFFAGYSYPRISVYDDYNGWDLLEHNGQQEFYNDFNDYTFSVKAPRNYVVWATGDFLNPEEVLQPAVALRLKASYSSDEVIHVASSDDMLAGKVTMQQDWNTWKFAYKHITDFTFAVSNHYVWDAGSVLIDKSRGRRVSMQAAYNPTAKDFENSVKWGKHTLQYYSQHLPGVAYPYPKMTAFHGYGDMEFPMMVNDESVQLDVISARMLQDHEMAHTYFPFYMGINETRYGFMDEGWAVFFTYFLSRDLFGDRVGDNILKSSRIGRWNLDASSEMDMPLITMSSQLTGKAYRNNTYNKAVASYLALRSLLGDDLFKQALVYYMDTWQGKHPIPWDFFYSINAATKKNLNWFWNNWFFSNYYMDLKIEEVRLNENTADIKVANVGGLFIPAQVKVFYKNGTVATEYIKVEDWQNTREKIFHLSLVKGLRPTRIEVDNGVFVDATPADNTWSK